MPKIPTYGSQEYVAQDQSIKSPVSTQTAGLRGQAIAGVGKSLAGLGDVIHKRKVQEEVTNTHTQLSLARDEFTQSIQSGLNKGDLNSEKFVADYQKRVEEISAGITTSEGQSYLKNQSAVLGSQLVRSASIGQAQLAGKKAVEQWQVSTNANANALQNDPASFIDTVKASNEALDAQVQAGVIPAESADKIKRVTADTLAESAVRGWAGINPQTAKDLLDQGTYDKYISPDTKKSLYSYINTQENANEIEKNRLERAEKDAQQKKSLAWENENLSKIENHSLSTKEILDSPMNPQKKIQWLNMQKAALKAKTDTDPRVKNEMIRRALLPETDPRHIADPSQFYEKVGNGLSISDAKQLVQLLDSTPEGKLRKDNRSRLFKEAEATLVKRDPVMGLVDPQGERNLSRFANDLARAEEELRKEGKPISNLYNPNSKDYFGNHLIKYKSSPQEVFQRQMESYQTDKNENQKKIDESPEDYLKRIGQ